MPFVKGQSGNPGGRAKIKLPDGRSLAEIARAHTPKAVQALVDVLDSGESSDAAKVSAANSLLDRAWGKAHASVSVEVTQDDSIASVLEQARRRASEGKPSLN